MYVIYKVWTKVLMQYQNIPDMLDIHRAGKNLYFLPRCRNFQTESLYKNRYDILHM